MTRSGSDANETLEIDFANEVASIFIITNGGLLSDGEGVEGEGDELGWLAGEGEGEGEGDGKEKEDELAANVRSRCNSCWRDVSTSLVV